MKHKIRRYPTRRVFSMPVVVILLFYPWVWLYAETSLDTNDYDKPVHRRMVEVMDSADRQRVLELEKEVGRLQRILAERETEMKEEREKVSRQLRDESWIREGKALREHIGDPDNQALIHSLNDVGLIFMADGNLDRAEEMFRRALVLVDRTVGRSKASAGTVLGHVADVARLRQDFPAALSFYQESAKAFSASVGERHPRYAAALNSWAGMLHSMKQWPEAEKRYRDAIAIYERTASQRPADLATSLHNLGYMLLEQGRLDEAGPLLERAADLIEKIKRPNDMQALLVNRSLARFYRVTGQMEKAAGCEARAEELALNVLSQ